MSITELVTMMFLGLAWATLATTAFVPPVEDDYVQNTLSRCSSSLYDLTVCLAEERSLIFEIQKCDELLAQTFICLSSGPDMAYAQAQEEAEENGDSLVVKRGLGRCIHKCLKGQGRMNFIQCKSMCHR